MFKKKAPLLVIAGSAVFAALLAVGTLGWFSADAKVSNPDQPIDGSVQDEYYASGSGTEDKPFIITKPRHLYNLAWLQYLGFYNKNQNDSVTSENHQFYFELGANVDMGQFGAIPPIGSELNPFVGNFDGKGYAISNLTISNNFEDYNAHPSIVSGWNNSDRKQPHILGLFGIIGEYDSNSNMPYHYDSTVTEFKNTAISGATITTEVSDVLMGVAAGYVNDAITTDSHYVLSNIAVDDSKIDTGASTTTAYDSANLTENISDYTLVGYTNNTKGVVKASKSVYGVNKETNITFSATEDGDVQGWGGSIDMKTMYQGVLNVSNIATSSNNYLYKYSSTRTIVEDINGNIISDEYSEPTQNNSANLYWYEQKNSEGKVTSSYSIKNISPNYVTFLYGHNDEATSGNNTTAVTRTHYSTTAAISIASTVSGTTHYMAITGDLITDTTTSTSAAKWIFDSDGYFKTSNDGENYLYLWVNDDDAFGVTDDISDAFQWQTLTSGNNKAYYYTSGNSVFYITYDNGWKLYESNDPAYYLIKNTTTGSNYIQRNGTNVQRTISSSSATKWYWNGAYFYPEGDSSVGLVYYAAFKSGGGNRITSAIRVASTSASTSYILTSNTDPETISPGQSTQVRISASNAPIKFNNQGNVSSRSTVYLRYSNNAWTTSTSSQNVAIEKVLPNGSARYVTTPSNGSLKIKTVTNSTETAKFETKHTFFPLKQKENNGVPADNNTGYVISGTDDGNDQGDIRISAYTKSTYLPNGVNTVYTINNSGTQTVTSGGTDQALASTFQKYSASKKTMKTVLDGDSSIYGLHFMDGQIKFGNGVSAMAESATINGETFSNYELPTSCVDFYLKEKGFINFFAGSYFHPGGTQGTNNAFFSLHEVQRNGNTIINVKEIAEVLSDGVTSHSYQYKFTNGTYSVPFMFDGETKKTLSGGAYTEYSTTGSAATGYSTVFKTTWIKQNSLTLDTAYYFEIPMNDGEFCLGSIPGTTGAYLMYLDIAANAAKTTRTVFYERFIYNEQAFSYPTGVSLKSLTISGTTAIIDIEETLDDADSACMVIYAGATGEYGMDRDVNDVTLTRAQAANAPPNYAGDDITKVHEKDSNVDIEPISLSFSSYEIRRMSYYDYIINTNSLRVTTFSDYYDIDENGGRNIDRRVIEQSTYSGHEITDSPTSTLVYDPDDASTAGNLDDIKVYKSSDGVRIAANSSSLTIDLNKLSEAVILKYRVAQEGSTSYDDATVLIVDVDNNFTEGDAYFFTYGGYTITLTPESGGTITVTVESLSSFTMTTYNFETNASSTTSGVSIAIVLNGTTVSGAGQVITNP